MILINLKIIKKRKLLKKSYLQINFLVLFVYIIIFKESFHFMLSFRIILVNMLMKNVLYFFIPVKKLLKLLIIIICVT